MAHHNGIKKGTRYKLQKTLRTRGMPNVTKCIQDFENGQKVHIVLDASIQKGQPHPRFHGRTGTVVGRRGRAWLLEVKDGGQTKTIIARPQHLTAQKIN
ncbi:MAG TPA: 50S ribosomal protein L21e [Methanocorpusculum sp.]|nr:50S ribosomal protein L21e [Methanocorpusculum sp.]